MKRPSILSLRNSVGRKSPILALCLILSALTASSSWSETSPLSALPPSFGTPVSNYNARERAMGEAGMASINKSGPSLPNPSRTAFNDKTSFAATFETDLDYLQDNETSNRASSFAIPSIALNFQTQSAINFGVYYGQLFHRNFSYTPMVPSNPDAVQSLTFEGGLYEIAGTLAYAPIPMLSIALGYHLLLGRERSIESSVHNANLADSSLRNSVNLEGDTLSIRSSGGYPSVSVTLRQKSFSLAASWALGATLDRTYSRSITNLASSQTYTDQRDLPWSLAVGGAWKLTGSQTVVGDVAYQAWDDNVSTLLNPAFHSGVGYEFQGNGGAYETYYRKIAYRGGAGFERLYLDETNVYFLTLGAGLPLGRRGNLFDVALKYGHQGRLENSLGTEDFIKLTVTMTGVGVWGQPVRKRR